MPGAPEVVPRAGRASPPRLPSAPSSLDQLPQPDRVDLAYLRRRDLALGARVVRHPPAQLGQDLRRPAPGGADQEHMPEPVLVGGVGVAQCLPPSRRPSLRPACSCPTSRTAAARRSGGGRPWRRRGHRGPGPPRRRPPRPAGPPPWRRAARRRPGAPSPARRSSQQQLTEGFAVRQGVQLGQARHVTPFPRAQHRHTHPGSPPPEAHLLHLPHSRRTPVPEAGRLARPSWGGPQLGRDGAWRSTNWWCGPGGRSPRTACGRSRSAVRDGRIAALAGFGEALDAVGDGGTAGHRGAPARPGGHARARQRAGPDRVGGLRDRDQRRPRRAGSPR